MNSPLDNTAWVVELLDDVKYRFTGWNYQQIPHPPTISSGDGGCIVPRLSLSGPQHIDLAVSYDGDALINGEPCRWGEVKDKILALCPIIRSA